MATPCQGNEKQGYSILGYAYGAYESLPQLQMLLRLIFSTKLVCCELRSACYPTQHVPLGYRTHPVQARMSLSVNITLDSLWRQWRGMGTSRMWFRSSYSRSLNWVRWITLQKCFRSSCSSHWKGLFREPPWCRELWRGKPAWPPLFPNTHSDKEQAGSWMTAWVQREGKSNVLYALGVAAHPLKSEPKSEPLCFTSSPMSTQHSHPLQAISVTKTKVLSELVVVSQSTVVTSEFPLN